MNNDDFDVDKQIASINKKAKGVKPEIIDYNRGRIPEKPRNDIRTFGSSKKIKEAKKAKEAKESEIDAKIKKALITGAIIVAAALLTAALVDRDPNIELDPSTGYIRH